MATLKVLQTNKNKTPPLLNNADSSLVQISGNNNSFMLFLIFTGVSLRVEPTLQLGLTLPGEISPLSTHPSGETLEESMARLEKGLVTGTLLLHFEVGPCECFTACVTWRVCVCIADNCHLCMCLCVLLLTEVVQKERRNVNVLCKAV